MSRYINYDDLDYRNDMMHGKSSEFLDGVIYMAQRIEEAPSIDIVRCKDCKHCDYEQEDDIYHCYMLLHRFYNADNFCSYGEQKEMKNDTD